MENGKDIKTEELTDEMADKAAGGMPKICTEDYRPRLKICATPGCGKPALKDEEYCDECKEMMGYNIELFPNP